MAGSATDTIAVHGIRISPANVEWDSSLYRGPDFNELDPDLQVGRQAGMRAIQHARWVLRERSPPVNNRIEQQTACLREHLLCVWLNALVMSLFLFFSSCLSGEFMRSQDALYDHLKERNIDDDLAAFICMYADQKEQTEYTNWLGEMAKFVK